MNAALVMILDAVFVLAGRCPVARVHDSPEVIDLDIAIDERAIVHVLDVIQAGEGEGEEAGASLVINRARI